MKLTEEQQTAIDLIEKDTHQDRLIAGFAGTGKTSLLRYALDRIVPHLDLKVTPQYDEQGLEVNRKVEGGICLVAPTHKALKVLRSKMPDYEDAVQYRTLASLLCKFPEIDSEGHLRYLGTSPNREEYTKIFIDEASMVSRDNIKELNEIITPPIIFLGDPAQLPPIKENISEVFNIKNQVLLQQVHRQTGPLIDFLLDCRKYTRKEARQKFNIPEGSEYPGVEYLEYPQMELFNDEWEDNPDIYRILCWTNKQVVSYNKMARFAHKGKGWGFHEGEKVMCGDAITRRAKNNKNGKWEDVMIVPASTEMIVTEVSEGTYNGYQALKVMTNIAETAIKAHRKVYGVIPRQLWVLNPKDRSKYEAQLKKYREVALTAQQAFDDWKIGYGNRNYPQNTEIQKQQKKAWRDYYSYQSLFDDIRHLYAMTVHRSQGSQFLRGYVDGQDIGKCRKVGDHNRLWYTAASRFSNGFSYR